MIALSTPPSFEANCSHLKIRNTCRIVGKNRRIWGPGGPPIPPSWPPARHPVGEVEDTDVHDGVERSGHGNADCPLLVDVDDFDGYVKNVVSASTDASVRQHVANRCFFRCLHLTDMTTISGGGTVCAVPIMVISPTPALLLMCMYLRLSVVLRVCLHTSKGVSVPVVCCFSHSEGAMRDVFRAGADGHGLDVKLDAAEWLLPSFFDQNLEAISNLKKYSICCMNCWTHVSIHIHLFRISSVLPLKNSDLYFQPMVFAAQGLECQRWNIILSVSLWSQVNRIATILKHQLYSHTTNEIHGQQRFWSCCACKTIKRGNAIGVQNSFLMISARTKLYLPDDHFAEDIVLPPFGLCHQRWTTTPLSLIPRFNGGDPLRLSSVMVPQNLQLNPLKPRVHTPDRPSGEPPAGHQLVWSTQEALGDCRSSNIESVLSTDERSLFGFIGNFWYQLQV